MSCRVSDYFVLGFRLFSVTIQLVSRPGSDCLMLGFRLFHVGIQIVSCWDSNYFASEFKLFRWVSDCFVLGFVFAFTLFCVTSRRVLAHAM